MKFLSPIEKSNSTLASTTSVLSGSQGSSSANTSNGQNGDHSNISDTDSELSFNECDITLVDDLETIKSDPKNEAEMMFLQVMEVLRFEQEVCTFFFYTTKHYLPLFRLFLRLSACLVPSLDRNDSVLILKQLSQVLTRF